MVVLLLIIHIQKALTAMTPQLLGIRRLDHHDAAIIPEHQAEQHEPRGVNGGGMNSTYHDGFGLLALAIAFVRRVQSL